MRRLITATLSALILLCVPLSPPQGCGTHSIGWPPLMINPLRVGSPAATSLRPGAPPVQAPASERGAAPSAQESISLEPGKPVERELSGGQSHSYKVTMGSGQYLHVVVAQRGIDVAVALVAPDGKKISEADSDHLIEGSETVSAITEMPGAYLIEVRSPEKTAKTGRYEIKVEELRAATVEAKYRVAGESVFREAERLQNGTLEAKRKSIEKYHEALDLYRRATDRSGEAQTLNNIGEVYWLLGEMRKALEKFNEALPIFQLVSDRRGEAVTLNNIGAIYWALGETQKALDKYNEALLIFQEIGDRNGEATILLEIARVEQKRGDLTQARQTIEQAVSIIESLRTNIAGQELRASYFASRQEFFETYIDVLMKQRRQNPAAGIDAVALSVSERARARSLLELLEEARAEIRQGVDSSLLERERSLQQRLNARAAAQVRLLNRKHTPEQADAAAKEIAAITDEYEEVQAQIRARSPRYAALTQPQPLSLMEIQQQALDEDTLLLEYALGEQRSYLWLVSQRSIDSYELPPRAELEAVARRVYELLTARPKRGTPPDPQFVVQARTLSRMLLGPVAQRLGGKRLVVVAPGALSYLPFAALPAPEDKKPLAGDYEPLIAKHEVATVPSASVLSIIRRETAGRQRATKSVAVLADPVFEVSDPRLESIKNGNSSGETPAAPAADEELSGLTRAIRTMNFSDARAGFTRLAFSRQEADSIIALTPKETGLKATDFNASRELAMSRQLSEYRILHFATHGLLNGEHPELSGLVFSLIDQEGKPQDGFLRLHEIYNLQLSADLIVLSACETGLGKEIKGEGLIGLTRGFMYSGAPRVVASLWNVDDLATAELMKLFDQRMLKDGLPAGAALRAAQLELSRQKRWVSPYFWAGFVLHGEWK